MTHNHFLSKENTKFIIALCLIVFIFGIAMSFSPIISDSMEPTLMTGDIVIYNNFAYLLDDIERGDIVTFKLEEDRKLYSKRVIALAGDKVEFHNGYVYLNDNKLDERQYLAQDVETNCIKSFMVPDNCCFVLGDNRGDSKDSRYFEEPYIPLENVKGRMLYKFSTNKIISIFKTSSRKT